MKKKKKGRKTPEVAEGQIKEIHGEPFCFHADYRFFGKERKKEEKDE